MSHHECRQRAGRTSGRWIFWRAAFRSNHSGVGANTKNNYRFLILALKTLIPPMSSHARSTASLFLTAISTVGLPALTSCGTISSMSVCVRPSTFAHNIGVVASSKLNRRRSQPNHGSLTRLNPDRDRLDVLFQANMLDSSRDLSFVQQYKPVPIVGCPAKSISRLGVKIRTRAAQSFRPEGKTKVVSERFSSWAVFAIVMSSSPVASGKTAREFPSKGGP